LAGAPVGSEVNVDMWGKAINIVVVNDKFIANPLSISILFDRDSNRPLELLPHKLEVVTNLQGQGLASRMVALTAHTAARLGFSKIIGNALLIEDSEHSTKHNGAYTFARLGFDCPLSDEIIGNLPTELANCRLLTELVSSSRGVEFWRHNAHSIPVQFDLLPNSRSWVVLKSYLAEKNIRIINDKQKRL